MEIQRKERGGEERGEWCCECEGRRASTNMGPEVGELDEAMPDKERRCEVKVLRYGRRSVLTLSVRSLPQYSRGRERRREDALGSKRT